MKYWCRLTPREVSICELVCDGLSNKEIGAKLNLKEGSIKNALRRIFDKVGADTRLQLALLLTADKAGVVKEI